MSEENLISFKSAVALVLIFLTLGVLFVYSDYQNVALENGEIKNTVAIQGKEILALKNEINTLILESGGKVDELKKQLEAEEKLRMLTESERVNQEKLSQNKMSNLEQKLLEVKSSSFDLNSVIKDWEPRVVYVECDLRLSNSNNYYTTNGSGVLLKFENSVIKIITNRHVLIGPAFYKLTSCLIKLPAIGNEFTIPVDDIEVSASNYDWASLDIKNPTQKLADLVSVSPKLCSQKPSLGSQIVVLGYPSIGSKSSVTATDGIISGFDGDYFVTSAKVEQGNSGGAAILVKDNCLLGIPTFASLGQVESLARILDIWTIITK